jgi:hypothetical protein
LACHWNARVLRRRYGSHFLNEICETETGQYQNCKAKLRKAIVLPEIVANWMAQSISGLNLRCSDFEAIEDVLAAEIASDNQFRTKEKQPKNEGK